MADYCIARIADYCIATKYLAGPCPTLCGGTESEPKTPSTGCGLVQQSQNFHKLPSKKVMF